jgi:plasmid stability protein
VKNVTLALDDDTYRMARIAAARRDTSVSSLVKQYLQTLAATEEAPEKPAHELETLLAEIASRHPNFSCRDNLSREALYESRR